MICGICEIQESKYKCPKCSVSYCSLVCFKSEKHVHETVVSSDTNTNTSDTSTSATATGNRFDVVLLDPQIQAMLKIKPLQFHLSTIMKILSDQQLTNEPTTEGRREIANKKICNLRIGGIEENELIEDFVLRVLLLLNDY